MMGWRWLRPNVPSSCANVLTDTAITKEDTDELLKALSERIDLNNDLMERVIAVMEEQKQELTRLWQLLEGMGDHHNVRSARRH